MAKDSAMPIRVQGSDLHQCAFKEVTQLMAGRDPGRYDNVVVVPRDAGYPPCSTYQSAFL
ncbi:MAG: hypothetical protein HY913_23200 [Desulfomonile tiedjei]|nr:hypothetical protein [Desulfomonile tiedjei]